MAAIYCPPWPKDLELTTTLYPIVIVDSMIMAAVVDSGYMVLLPHAEIAQDQDVLLGTYIQKRWFYFDGPYENYLAQDQNVLLGTYVQKRWYYFDGPYEDYLEQDQNILAGSYVSKRVLAVIGRAANEPWEQLQLGIVIANTCTMEAV